MSEATHSPLPWRAIWCGVYRTDKKERIAECVRDSMRGYDDDEIAKADAALIVAAVNEREKLRGLVRRMLPFIERSRDRLCDGQRLHGTEGDFSPAIHELTEIIIEADAALGKTEAKKGGAA
jgi:hypothetical protein